MSLEKVVSGGQTGVDRAALDAAIALHIPHGGYCTKGRRAEDGYITFRYHLTELDDLKYEVRTERNVMESDGTLIIADERLTGGTLLTSKLCAERKKPLLKITSAGPEDPESFHQWLSDSGISTLNVAGPRESRTPGIYQRTFDLLSALLERYKRP